MTKNIERWLIVSALLYNMFDCFTSPSLYLRKEQLSDIDFDVSQLIGALSTSNSWSLTVPTRLLCCRQISTMFLYPVFS